MHTDLLKVSVGDFAGCSGLVYNTILTGFSSNNPDFFLKFLEPSTQRLYRHIIVLPKESISPHRIVFIAADKKDFALSPVRTVQCAAHLITLFFQKKKICMCRLTLAAAWW